MCKLAKTIPMACVVQQVVREIIMRNQNPIYIDGENYLKTKRKKLRKVFLLGLIIGLTPTAGLLLNKPDTPASYEAMVQELEDFREFRAMALSLCDQKQRDAMCIVKPTRKPINIGQH